MFVLRAGSSRRAACAPSRRFARSCITPSALNSASTSRNSSWYSFRFRSRSTAAAEGSILILARHACFLAIHDSCSCMRSEQSSRISSDLRLSPLIATIFATRRLRVRKRRPRGACLRHPVASPHLYVFMISSICLKYNSTSRRPVLSPISLYAAWIDSRRARKGRLQTTTIPDPWRCPRCR